MVPQVRPVTVAVKAPVDEVVPAETVTPPLLKPIVVKVPDPRLVRFPLRTADVAVTLVAETVVTLGGTPGQASVVNSKSPPYVEPTEFTTYEWTQ